MFISILFLLLAQADGIIVPFSAFATGAGIACSAVAAMFHIVVKSYEKRIQDMAETKAKQGADMTHALNNNSKSLMIAVLALKNLDDGLEDMAKQLSEEINEHPSNRP